MRIYPERSEVLKLYYSCPQLAALLQYTKGRKLTKLIEIRQANCIFLNRRQKYEEVE
ncbi:hypothetical protein [Methanosarcina sp.]|uniref:hypothetical protein n=1 Tax=Methanosarcina sp. TaxID=2213 RepID=UPI003C761E92